jgi:hypothetical protein
MDRLVVRRRARRLSRHFDPNPKNEPLGTWRSKIFHVIYITHHLHFGLQYMYISRRGREARGELDREMGEGCHASMIVRKSPPRGA